MPSADLIIQARQGNPTAIATLLNHSLQAQNIQAEVRHRSAELLVMLTCLDPVQQSAIVPRIMQGLQRLQVQGIESVQVAAQQSGATQILWRTRVRLPALASPSPPLPEGAASSTNVEAPTQPKAAVSADITRTTPPSLPDDDSTPPNLIIAELPGTPNPLILPGWSFWLGWVALSVLGLSLASFWDPYLGAHPARYLAYFLKLTLTPCLIATGQWVVLRQEVTWAKEWIYFTAIGGIASSFLQVSRLILTRQWDWLSNLPQSFWLLVLLVLVISPVAIAQWYLLRRHLTGIAFWPKVMAAWVGVNFFLRLWLPTDSTLGAIGINVPWLLSIAHTMVSGGAMLYLLRQSAPNLLKLNRFTDATTRRLLLRQRAKVNGILFLEWLGWTLLGWIVGAVLQGFLGVLTLGLSGLFSLAILVSTGAGFQWIALRSRITNSQLWFKFTVSTAFSGALIAMILGLLFSSLAFGSILTASAPKAGFWAYTVVIGIGFLFLSLSWFSVIGAQGYVLKQQGYRLSWWLGTHLAFAPAILATRPWQGFGYLLPGMLFWMILMPAAIMVWLLGYPRSLQPHFQRYLD